MRNDSEGFFWIDEEIRKAGKAAKAKCSPPARTWESPDYLPGYDEAVKFDVQLMAEEELKYAVQSGDKFVFDIECYPNYLLIAFQSLATGKVVIFEKTTTSTFDNIKLHWLVHNACLISFNGIKYDIVILAMALAGKSCEEMKYATNRIILEDARPYDILKSYKLKKLNLNHIDLIEVAPLKANLKIYGGRMHAPRMQDLPFDAEICLSPPQIVIVRWYCVNDLRTTALLNSTLSEQIVLRENMSDEYGMDLRSKSDAQIAEHVISEQVANLNGSRCTRPTIDIGTCYQYQVPHFIKYHSEILNWALQKVAYAQFVVDETGSVGIPEELKELNIKIADSTYHMGNGGLHSSEQKIAHRASENIILQDTDVVSYYPMIILILGLFPKHLGRVFLQVYRSLVDRRIEAKVNMLQVIADILKIVVNGTFGKLGSKYSILYAPDLLMQVTITGQLCLLMLIERFELNGISVVSANTDGVVTKCHKSLKPVMEQIIKDWEKVTGFTTESAKYIALYSRDVNNYIAVKEGDKKNPLPSIKSKGAYSNPWSDNKNLALRLHKNPTNQICIEAVEALLLNGTPVEKTVRECLDICKFVSVRTVKGGAVKDGVYLGKSLRWYYSGTVGGEVIYAASGKKVPRSDNARPLMDLPQVFPDDVNHDWYIGEANKYLKEIGYYE